MRERSVEVCDRRNDLGFLQLLLVDLPPSVNRVANLLGERRLQYFLAECGVGIARGWHARMLRSVT
jgi:hypothetical protein